MKRLLVIGLLALAGPAAAHPGVGIVMDPHGNVYFTDLAHVWRIAPDGRKTIAVRNVHTHELGMDAEGNLTGEDLEYVGGDRYRHRIWRRTAAGHLSNVVPWRDGFWRDYSFVRDRAGTSYLVRCEGSSFCTVQKRTADGHVSDAAPGFHFGKPLNWLAVGSEGDVFVSDGRDLRRIDAQGHVTTVAHAGGELMGLWPTASGNVYVAVYGSREVIRVTPDGRPTIVARAEAPWAPSGMFVAGNGDLWVLEYSESNEARVRRFGRDGRVTTY